MLETIINHFSLLGTFVRAERFGSGLINDTYLCEFLNNNSPRKYILQRINQSVFKHPDQVMTNVEAVTTHIAKKLRAEGVHDPDSVTPSLIQTQSGKSYHLDDDGSYWRMFHFIESGMVLDRVADAQHAYEVGRGLGRFQALVSDLPPDDLYDTLPGFHYTTLYLSAFDDALMSDVAKRDADISSERQFVFRRRSLATVLVDRMRSKDVPLRVVHNDPKVNNIMIHSSTREALCMLDLDTVKPGIVHFDFGDCVRSAANPAGENEEDLGKVGIDLALFDAVATGYLREAASFLTKNEVEMLPVSVKVITFELGLRFLADYIRGDTYFKIRYPTHNLHRARVQFKLLESIEAFEDRMTSILMRQ